jgi:hypothetical protein
LHRNSLIKHNTEGKLDGGVEVTKRQGRKRKQITDGPTEKRGYWKLKEEELDLSV